MVHSATMSDVHLDHLDWNVHNLHPDTVATNPHPPIVHSNNDSSDYNDNLTRVEDTNHVVDVVDQSSSLDDDSAPVQNSYSMFTIISTPKMKGMVEIF